MIRFVSKFEYTQGEVISFNSKLLEVAVIFYKKKVELGRKSVVCENGLLNEYPLQQLTDGYYSKF